MTRNIWVVVVVAMLVAGGWWYLNQSSAAKFAITQRNANAGNKALTPRLPASEGSESNLGVYTDLPNGICGGAIPMRNIKTIPNIGCFVLTSDQSVSGKINGRAVTLSIDISGQPVFNVDGKVITSTFDPQNPGPLQTNDPGVTNTAIGGYHIGSQPCNNNVNNCPTSIEPITFNGDKSIIFAVSQCIGNGCAAAQWLFDELKARQRLFDERKSRQK